MSNRCLWMCAAGLPLVLLFNACQARQPEPQPEPQPQYELTATVKDIMDSMVDPIADVLWESVATIVTHGRTEERVPKTDEDWLKVRRGAITLIEATNLLRMPGRKIARPGEKSEYPNIELEPDEIQVLMDKDRETWNKMAHALHAAASEALRAIEARNAPGLGDAGEQIDSACESCHLKYWYPNQVIPEFPKNLPASN